MGVGRRRSSQHKGRQSYIKRMASHRITNFYTNLHTLVGSSKPRRMSITTSGRKLARKKNENAASFLRRASGSISRERFNRVSPNFTRLSGTILAPQICQIWRQYIVALGRLQNAIKYCTWVPISSLLTHMVYLLPFFRRKANAFRTIGMG